MNKMMKSSIYNIFMSGVLVLLLFVSCTDDMIEASGALHGVDRNKQVEVILPFGVGRGISTTITTRAAGNGEISYDSQLSGVMVFVYEAKSENPEENELLAYHLFSNPSDNPLEGATGGWIEDNDDPTCGAIKFYIPVGDVYIYLLGNAQTSFLDFFPGVSDGDELRTQAEFSRKPPRNGTEIYTAWTAICRWWAWWQTVRACATWMKMEIFITRTMPEQAMLSPANRMRENTTLTNRLS